MRQTEKAWNLRLDAEDALGEWLGRMEWDYWGTWTFAEKRTARSIRRAIEAHIDRIGASRAFWCVEGGRRNGRLHLHGLLYFDSKSAANASGPPASAPTAAEISGDWTRRHGWADIDVYDGGRGAAYYVSERVGRDIVDYDLQGKGLEMDLTDGGGSWRRRDAGRASLISSPGSPPRPISLAVPGFLAVPGNCTWGSALEEARLGTCASGNECVGVQGGLDGGAETATLTRASKEAFSVRSSADEDTA
jgi:hypothetical protein